MSSSCNIFGLIFYLVFYRFLKSYHYFLFPSFFCLKIHIIIIKYELLLSHRYVHICLMILLLYFAYLLCFKSSKMRLYQMFEKKSWMVKYSCIMLMFLEIDSESCWKYINIIQGVLKIDLIKPHWTSLNFIKPQ